MNPKTLMPIISMIFLAPASDLYASLDLLLEIIERYLNRKPKQIMIWLTIRLPIQTLRNSSTLIYLQRLEFI